MEQLLYTTEGSVVLIRDTELLGVVTGNVTVPRGIHLVMDGMVMGDLVVLEGGTADVNGVVMGFIINDGGAVKVAGLEGQIGHAGVIPPRAHRASRAKPSFWGALSQA